LKFPGSFKKSFPTNFFNLKTVNQNRLLEYFQRAFKFNIYNLKKFSGKGAIIVPKKHGGFEINNNFPFCVCERQFYYLSRSHFHPELNNR